MTGQLCSPRVPPGLAAGLGDRADAGRSTAVSLSRRSRTLVPDPPSSGHQQLSFSSWPLRTFLELRALPGAVPCTRLHARQMVWEWGLAELGDDTELVVSELVSNSVAASAAVADTPVVRFWLFSDGVQVLVLVWDASPRRPVRMETDDEAESGRGLLLVEAVSARWGCYFPLDGSSGKCTWALVRAEGRGPWAENSMG